MKKLCFVLMMGPLAVSAANDSVAVSALKQACPGLVKFADEVQVASPRKEAASLTLQRERGWKGVYSFRAAVQAKPGGDVARVFKATGEMCTFELESATASTVAVSKSACMSLCAGEAVAQGGVRPYVAYFGVDGSRRFAH